LSKPSPSRLHALLLLLLPLVTGLLRLIGLTLRIRRLDPHGRAPQNCPEPTVYAFWHAHQLLAMYHFRNFGIRVLVSRSQDGDYIAGALKHFGFGTVRSSTSSGKVAALRGLARELKHRQHVAITPDGPRGPVHRAQAGAVFLAAMTGAPLVPFGCAVDRAWRLRSWDRFEIPKPFGRAVIAFGEPLNVPSKPDAGEIRRLVQELEDRLGELEKTAQAELARGRRA